MSFKLSPDCLDRVGSMLAGVAAVAGEIEGRTAGVPNLMLGGVSASAGVLSACCSGSAALGQHLDAQNPTASKEISVYLNEFRNSWQSWSKLDNTDASSQEDIEAARWVFENYFSSAQSVKIPNHDEIIKCGLNADLLTICMLENAAKHAPEDYSDEPLLQENRKFFKTIIFNALSKLVNRKSFLDSLDLSLAQHELKFKETTSSQLSDISLRIKDMEGIVKQILDTNSEPVSDPSELSILRLLLTDALNSLVSTPAGLVSKAELEEAISGVKSGNCSLAENILEKIAESSIQNTNGADAEKSSIDTAKAYKNLGVLSSLRDSRKAILSFEKAVDTWPNDMDVWTSLGHLYKRVGEYGKAKNSYEMILKNGSSTHHSKSLALPFLGHLYSEKGRIDEAYSCYKEALEIAIQEDDSAGMAINYGNLGNIHRDRDEMDSACEMYEKSLELNRKIGRERGAAIQYGNCADIFSYRGEYDKAFDYYDRAIKLHVKHKSLEKLANTFSNLGASYRAYGDHKAALDMYEESLLYNKKLMHKKGVAINYYNIGLLLGRQGDIDGSIEHLKKSHDLLTQLKSPKAAEVEKTIIKVQQSFDLGM